jgi:hypothetical protein
LRHLPRQVAETLCSLIAVLTERRRKKFRQLSKNCEYGGNPSRETLNLGIFEASSTTPQNLVLATSAMAAVPALVFFLIFQRNILAVLTAGSLKADERRGPR